MQPALPTVDEHRTSCAARRDPFLCETGCRQPSHAFEARPRTQWPSAAVRAAIWHPNRIIGELGIGSHHPLRMIPRLERLDGDQGMALTNVAGTVRLIAPTGSTRASMSTSLACGTSDQTMRFHPLRVMHGARPGETVPLEASPRRELAMSDHTALQYQTASRHRPVSSWTVGFTLFAAAASLAAQRGLG